MSRNSSHPDVIRARALAFASCLMKEVGGAAAGARSRVRSPGDASRLRELADDNARLRELLAQPMPLATLPPLARSIDGTS